MATVLATLNPLNFPGAEKVSPCEGGYTVYGPEKDGRHPAIAVMRQVGKDQYIVDAEPEVVSKLVGATALTAAEAQQQAPFYETTIEFVQGKRRTKATHVGPMPVGDNLNGHKILSTRPAPEWTLEKVRQRAYIIAKPKEDLDELLSDSRLRD